MTNKVVEENRYLADAMPLLVWIASVNGDITYFNQRWFEYTGLTLAQTEGWDWQQVLHPDDLQLCLEMWNKSVRTGEPYQVEVRYKRASDNSYRWHLARALPIRDNAGKISSWVGTSTDIDEQKQAELRLRFLTEAGTLLSSSLNYEVTLTQIARLAIAHLADWCSIDILDANGELRRLALMHADPAKIEAANELQKRFPVDMNARSGVPEVIRSGKSILIPYITDDLIVQSTNNPEQLTLIRELGLVSGMTVPLTVRSQTFGAISFIASQSGRHYTQADLTLAEELASRAAQAVDNARLYQESQEAVRIQQELDYLKNLFLSTATHELRTPLTSIRGFAQMVSRSLRNYAVEPNEIINRNIRSIEVIVEQVDRMNALIAQLLDFSRLHNEQFALNLSDNINLVDIIQRVIEQYSAVTINHTLDVNLPNYAVIGTWDEFRLEQVLNNLIGNAIKYSPPQTQVSIGLQPVPNNEVIISVNDQGYGISEEDQRHIFDRFYRVRNKETKKVDGLGLGLYITTEIVQKHGGRIWLESEIDKGTTFYVALPYKE